MAALLRRHPRRPCQNNLGQFVDASTGQNSASGVKITTRFSILILILTLAVTPLINPFIKGRFYYHEQRMQVLF
jgi:hypothetical protein